MEVPTGEKIIQKIFGKLNYIEKNNRRNLKTIKDVYKKQSNGGFNIDQNVAKMNWELTKIEKKYKKNSKPKPKKIFTTNKVDILNDDVFVKKGKT
jgi:hypothetical protein